MAEHAEVEMAMAAPYDDVLYIGSSTSRAYKNGKSSTTEYKQVQCSTT